MPKENHYAVVVGIDQYPDYLNGKKNLNCPQADALKVRDWLLSTTGGDLPPPVHPGGESPNITAITREIPSGRQPPRPIVNEVVKAIGATARLFHQKYALLDDDGQADIWKTGRLYLYFSGHGLDAAGNDAVLLSADAATGSLFHLSLLQVVNILKLAKTFRELVVWADCCRTASGIPISPVLLDLTSCQYSGPGDVRIFFARASKTQQPAYEPPLAALQEVPNSFFTYALVEGLNGAVFGASGGVRSSNLADYLRERVPQLSQRYWTADQRPDFEPDDDIEFVAGIAPTLYNVRLTAMSGSSFAGQIAVEICSHLDDPAGPSRHAVSIVSPGVFEAALPASLYELRLNAPGNAVAKFRFPVFGANMTLEI